MPGTPTREAVIGVYQNGRSDQNDFLQLKSAVGGQIFGWIDYLGTLQGSLAGGGGGGGNPGGFSGSVQFNNGSGGFGGDSSLVYNSSTLVLLSNTFNASVGFQIGGSAPSGNYLRGNGTNYVASSILIRDLPTTGTWPFSGTISGGMTFLATPTFPNQSANTVFAGPTGGGSTTPGFRALVAADIPTGAVLWNGLGNASGNLILSNGSFATTFNQTASVNWTWANTTSATNILNQDSPVLILSGNYWNGSASATQSWGIQATLANGLLISQLVGAAPASPIVTFGPNVQISMGGSITAGSGFFFSPSTANGANPQNLSSVANAAGGLTTYTGTVTELPSIGMIVTISGFTNGGNNGTFTVQSSTATTLVVYSNTGVAESHAATFTVAGSYFNDSNHQVTFGFGRPYAIQGTTYHPTVSVAAAPFVPQLIFNTYGDATDSSYVRTINDGSTGNHGLEIGSIIDGTGAAPVVLRLGVFGGATGIFATTNNYALGQVICSGQIALSTGAITSGTRATNTLSCAGLSTSTDSISCTFSGDTNAVTGYAPSASGGLTLKTWVSAGVINVDQINNTGVSITPGAATLNCKGIR